MILKKIILLLVIHNVHPKATITDNGYDDIIVAISPDVIQDSIEQHDNHYYLKVPEDPAIIDKLKELLTKTSEELYKASRYLCYTP